MSTPHNSAQEGQIAKTVLMPGDPLRAKFIAETYLESPVCFNTVRNMLGYTAERILRIGSAGGLADSVRLRDVVVGLGACTDSNYAAQFRLPGSFAPLGSFRLAQKAVQAAERLGVPVKVGNVLSSDLFYGDDAEALPRWKEMGVLAVEMESAALYMNAARAGKEALCLLTISDCPLRGESLPAEERQTGFRQMMEIALETAE